MGALHFLEDMVVDSITQGKESKLEIEAYELQGNVFLNIGPVGAAHRGQIIEFNNFEKFNKFVTAINGIHQRIKPE